MRRYQPEDYERLRQIVERLEADVIALQEVDDAFVEKVFDPDIHHLELSGRNSALQTGLAIRRGIHYERKAHVTVLDVRDLRYEIYIELHVGPHRIDMLSILKGEYGLWGMEAQETAQVAEFLARHVDRTGAAPKRVNRSARSPSQRPRGNPTRGGRAAAAVCKHCGVTDITAMGASTATTGGAPSRSVSTGSGRRTWPVWD